ncbi:MAG: S41 family peptidase [Prevotellaceae bacterium]|jgi:hypothetical protein|nr:S41 family peptidase [Prevotellaceae bacterium]
MKKIILLTILLGSACFLQAQDKFSKEILIKDFLEFTEILKATHPDPYSLFGGKMQFHRQAQNVMEGIDSAGLTKNEFRNVLSRFISKLQDGHTFIVRDNQEQKKTASKVLNLEFKILSDGLFVSQSVDGIYNGHRVLAVNGIPIDSLLSLVQMLDPCENIYGAYFSLVRILSSENSVHRLFPATENGKLRILLSKSKNRNTEYEIEYVDAGKRIIRSLSSAQLKTEMPKAAPFWYNFIDDAKKIVYFSYPSTYAREVIELQKSWGQDYTGNLKMLYNRYGLGQVPENYTEAIAKIPSINETFFEMLSKMKKNKSTHLIVDLRQNSGGWTPINSMSFYMLKGDAYFAYECEAEYNTLISERYLQKRNISIDDYNKQSGGNYKVGDYNFGYFMGGGWPGDMTLEDRRTANFEYNLPKDISGLEQLLSLNGNAAYSPKIVIVTSPATFSAAFHYMYFLQELCNAVVVGVSPRQAYNNGMESTFATLPETGVSISVSNSYQLFYPSDMEKGRVMIPDYPFTSTDFVKYNCDNNAEILYIMDLIASGKI